ncbi:metallophosphoesterase [Clostridium sp. MCC353]|uniref:metallophosphoesterase family protein n=1 Tax=Clostridium sp. MCC353 TaxID=2592646 RepID=UPI001C032908|nr:metallophosphoesterase family protein [Clostridium sp. MCC353]MBT9777998.1 metallophosphoesterase [Clostridium sp. MCC353]
MKILVISDIHGNIDALETVWRREMDSDEIICAGDLTDYGVFPKEVIDWIRTHNVRTVKGNHDAHTVHIYRDTPWKEAGPGEFKWVHHTCGQLTDEEISFLDQLPEIQYFEADGAGYLISHQYETGYRTVESRDQFNRFWACHEEKINGRPTEKRMVFGHTHRQGIHILGEGMLWLNPGSVSYRRPDDPCKDAQYMVIEDGKISFRSIPYDRSRSLDAAYEYLKRKIMMETELQDAFFFFGNAVTSREPLPEIKAIDH